MDRNVAHDWMWSEACEMLARAERMHRELFRPTRQELHKESRPEAQPQARLPAWEPPVDILETELEVLVLVALPGVDADGAQAVIEDGDLVIAGTRAVPREWRTAIIHRLELPQGRFYRRLRLPAGGYSTVRRTAAAGCLVISLQKVEHSRG
jgi:HSP20 family molecular chaperone IbpA